jgi:hypothetical protein
MVRKDLNGAVNRSAAIAFSNQLREARYDALRDSEAFDGIIHAVERLGSFLHGKIADLHQYKPYIEKIARLSELPNASGASRDTYVPFSLLYELVREARNDALHQGAFARRLTGHAIELSLILEDALRQSVDLPVVSDYMVRNPTCAEDWQPVSFVRQQMLANSFSFLPVQFDGRWCLVSDLEIACFLGGPVGRKERLAIDLRNSGIPLKNAGLCVANESITEALRIMGEDSRPLLVFPEIGKNQPLVGIVTPFDFL